MTTLGSRQPGHGWSLIRDDSGTTFQPPQLTVHLFRLKEDDPMKLSMLMSAAVLALSAPAIAQDSGQMTPPAPPAGEAQPDPSTAPTPNDMSAQQMPQTGQTPMSDPSAAATQAPPPPAGDSAAPMPPAPPAAETAPPPPAPRTDYPVCSKTVQDSCINPSEARKAKRRR